MKATAIWVVIVALTVAAFSLRGGLFGESAAVPPSEEKIEAAEQIAAEVEQEKTLKEQERRIEAEKHFNVAGEALLEGDYEVAIEELTAAVAGDPQNETYNEALQRAKIMQIRTMLSEKKFAQARDLCDQFLSDYPGNEAVARFRQQASDELEKPAVPAEREAVRPPTKEEVRPTADQLVKEARDLMLKKDYKMALEKLLEARKLSPYDISIDKKIKQLHEELARFERAYAEAMREELLAQIYEMWTKRPRRVVRLEEVEVEPAVKPISPHREKIEEKLELIIPEVKFEDAKLTEVVDFLSRQAEVNIVIDPVVFRGYTPSVVSPEAAPGYPETGTPGPGGPTPSTFPGGTTISPGGTTFGPGVTSPGVTVPGVTTGISDITTTGTWVPPAADTGIKLSLKNVPLKEVLKYVLKWRNLKYVVEDYAILIAPIDYIPPESLETEIFRLATTGFGIIERPELAMPRSTRGTAGETGTARGTRLLRGPTDIGGGGTTYDTGLFGEEGEPGAAETIEDFLRTSGVSWPRGSTIRYIPRTGTLIVTNTPTNMVLVRELVRLWDIPSHQVEITARFVEILHTRFYENSFEAQMLSPLIFTQKATGGPVPSTIRRSYEIQGFPSRAARYFPQLLPTYFPTPDADMILSIRGTMTDPDFQLVWRAIDQKDWSDLLSAPRVTTISGQQAQIEVVEELTYPTEYDTETINIGGWGSTTELVSGEIFMVTPGNWEKRDVGIILNVTPTVSADGKMIQLMLLPEVTDLVRWINYGTEIYPIQQPVFETRNVTTTVHVNDGETIVLGGLITDKTTTYEDKVPLLGSIPFIGRFFRTAAETTSKANLIIFVTARLITARGTEWAVERSFAEEQARLLERRIRETAEEAGEIPPAVGTTGVIE